MKAKQDLQRKNSQKLLNIHSYGNKPQKDIVIRKQTLSKTGSK